MGRRAPVAAAADRSDVHGRRRRAVWWLLATVVAVAVLAVTAVYAAGETLGGLAGLPVAPDGELEAAIEGRFAAVGADDAVRLEDATTFAWDRVGVFGPYVPHEAVVDRIGVRVPRGVTNHLSYDDRCLLVFAGEGRLAGWTVVSRGVAECAGDASGRVHRREDATFRGDHLVPASGR